MLNAKCKNVNIYKKLTAVICQKKKRRENVISSFPPPVCRPLPPGSAKVSYVFGQADLWHSPDVREGVGERREKGGHVAVNRNLCTLPAALKKRSHELLSQEEPGHRSSDRDTWQSTGKGNTVKQCLWQRFQHVCDFLPFSLPPLGKCTSKTLLTLTQKLRNKRLKTKRAWKYLHRITNPQSTSGRKHSTYKGHLIHNVFGDGPSAITSTWRCLG